MKCWKVLLIVVMAVVILGVAYGISLLHDGFSARERPSALETLLATSARALAIPSDYRKLQNPFPQSVENIQAGMEHFADHCATCHGNDGSGDTLFAKGLYPKPPDMRLAETQNKTGGELYYVIENGVRLSGMPAFGEEHTAGGDADTWKLVIFIRHLPNLTADEKKHMEELNPKTEEDRQEEKEEEEFLQGGEISGNPARETHHH